MTFINARILRKRPNLFVTPKRNYGNLLIKYESGTDGTAPDPDPPAPDPDPVTFTTSWTTNAGVVTANLTGISSHRTTEVIVLTRDDGTVLATLDENKVGNWDLQHDEGTSYGSYTYNVRLDGVIKSTFSRDYQPNVPSFTTNFFSNTAKIISCAIDTITNPHNSFTVKLAKLDGTILDTRVLNDATSFFLQFTELDYGTYDYQVLLNDTQVATHQHIFVRPEPTFTTSWTKSGLTINADLSSITGAHPEFYAYLCRDDGTTLATHQFTEGQTTTSLSFTETEYGSYNYQLKLGTVVKSSHTETYVRPTPTYTASFSTNELTLTASITGITNAHNSFAITLERDDGTVLSTHTLAENETSFNFTQTETSYATFNYIVKINGTQTDTYSATYTPPPTPTFDIALTNDDLAITATLTNIVNPDPYYTFMIHDANDTHLDGHTFATGDTTVVLTWTETSYGEKTYTKLLNGASIGTETITLTDPNASTPSYPSTLDVAGGNWGVTTFTLQSTSTTDEIIYWKAGDTAGTTAIYYKVSESKWYDGSSGGQPTAFSINDGTPSDPSAVVSEGDSVKLTAGSSGNYGSFTMFSTSSSSTPAVPQPTLVNTISLTDGDWFPSLNYQHQATDTTNTYYEYKISGAPTDTQFYIAYNWTTKKWYDTNPNTTHSTFGTSASDTTSTSRETGENPSIVYVMGDTPTSILKAQFNNPYYEPPTVVSPLPVLSQYTQAFGMEYYQTVGTKYYYKSDSHSGTGTSITYDYETKTWNDEGSQVPYHLNTTSTFASTTSLVNPAEIHGFGSQQNHNGTRYFSVSNPYYEAPAYRTGTSQGFAFTSGTWKGYGYTAIIDDEANSSSGKLVNGVRQWEWDMPDIGGGRLYSGANNWIYFVPGTAEDNGTWYHSSTSTGGTAGTRNGRVISIGTSATFDETNAFVDGLVPYGDIP